MWRGKRFRLPVNEYAIPRMEPGKQRPIQSMEEARNWERRFIGEIKAGLDPTRPLEQPKKEKTEIENVSEFLDAYFERCAKPAGLRSINTVRSQIGVLKENLGHLPLTALEDADENGLEPKAGEEGVKWNAEQPAPHRPAVARPPARGACRLLADGVDIRMIQLMLGHASIQQTQRYLNVTDEELRKGLEVSWGRELRAVSGQ